MNRKPILIAVCALVVGGAGLAAAHADALLGLARTPAVDGGYAQDRQVAKAAFTDVLAKKATTLGMLPPLNLAPYAPIYPDGLILQESEGAASATDGEVQYTAAASLRAALDFYEDAAALHRLPFTVVADGPDSLVFKAADGRRQVQARLTKQFANGTVVDLTYN